MCVCVVWCVCEGVCVCVRMCVFECVSCTMSLWSTDRGVSRREAHGAAV